MEGLKMALALINRHDLVSIDPVGDFLRSVPAVLHLDDLVEAMSAALFAHQATAHCCCAIDESGELIPLFGDDLTLATSTERNRIEIETETADGEPVLLFVATRAAVDRKTLATFRMLATLYATHGINLFDASDDIPPDGQITAIEQKCFSLTMAGWSHLDIAEHLDRSAPVIGIHLRRAAERLGVSSIAEASVIVASRGMLSILPVGPHPQLM
jgi:DNA-binding CsgD family transcriptional regulator